MARVISAMRARCDSLPCAAQGPSAAGAIANVLRNRARRADDLSASYRHRPVVGVRRQFGPFGAGVATAENLLDLTAQPFLVGRQERYRVAVGFSRGPPPDPVDVVLGNRRRVVVDDVPEFDDVDAAGGDVG